MLQGNDLTCLGPRESTDGGCGMENEKVGPTSCLQGRFATKHIGTAIQFKNCLPKSEVACI